jgi:HTH-type transcriptional regulator/antitoxin HigA
MTAAKGKILPNVHPGEVLLENFLKPAGKLIKFHVPRPIHDEVGYQNAVEVIDALAGQQVNEDQEDYLLVLAGIVERYESETLPAPRPVTGLAMLKYVLEENSLTGDDLATILDVDRSVAYRILKGDRGLTTTHVRALVDPSCIGEDPHFCVKQTGAVGIVAYLHS